MKQLVSGNLAVVMSLAPHVISVTEQLPVEVLVLRKAALWLV
jgi:hypothetical protein